MTYIITVSAFSDNYIWLICDEEKQYAIIVDPGDAAPVINALEAEKIEPIAIFITHFHYDHANGVPKLLEKYPELPVYGPASEYELLKENSRPPNYGPASVGFKSLTHPLMGGEELAFDQINASFRVMNVPGHTSGHIAYYGDQKLFCGDTLFASGCGRVFDGTFNDLHDSLQRIKKLPEDTLIYCAHEYTLDNIGFAKWVEPESQDIIKHEAAAMALIDSDQATVPFLLSQELKTNPFLRTDQADVMDRVAAKTGKQLTNSADVFSAMRFWKDSQYD